MAIDINIESQVSQTITDGVTDKAPSENAVFDALANKVDKETGKGLSEEDFTTAEKNKLAGIEAGAEVNVNADWNATSGDAEILNKPTIPSVTGLVPYTGAVANVDLGTHKLTAKDLVVNHPSGSGDAATITKGGSGEALKVVKSSGSGNAASITGGVTLLSELDLQTPLADSEIASAATWNAKIGGAVSIGQVAFGTASGVGGDSGLFWDNTNKRLGIGTSAPTTKLTIQDSNTSILRLRGDVGSGGIFITQPGNNNTFFAIGDDVNILGSTVNTLVTYFSSVPQRFYVNGSERLRIDSTGNVGIGTTSPTARLHVQAQGALSTDVAFRVRNSANTIDRLSLTGTAFSITTVNRAEMSVSANAINFGLENHVTNIIHASPATTSYTQTASSINRSFIVTNLGDGINAEALNKGCTIFGSTIRTGTFGNVQNKMHFVCDQTKWGLDGVYSAGFQWFRGNQSGDGGFNTATLPSITTANRQMWLTPENSLLFFNTPGITFTTNTDSFQLYSADITAGNAAPHFRTENGSVIKLYKQDLPTNPTNAELATFLSNLGLANLI